VFGVFCGSIFLAGQHRAFHVIDTGESKRGGSWAGMEPQSTPNTQNPRQ
jgi:hypothetical protein